MRTISKHTLNPLATCFVPLSMKIHHGIIKCDSFPMAKYEKPVAEYFRIKYPVSPIIRGKQTVTSCLAATKQILPNIKKGIEEPSVARETVSETLCDKTGNSNTGKSNRNHKQLKSSTNSEKNLIEFHTSQRKQQIVNEASKSEMFYVRLLFKWLLTMPNILSFNLCYQMELNRSINLYSTVLLSSTLKSISVFNSKKITYSSNIEEIIESREETSIEECHCPPMFGWIVPLDFLGNPLKLADMCSKKYVHTSYVCGSELEEKHFTIKDQQSDFRVESLDKYTSELRSIIKDVCDAVDQSLSHDSEVSENRKKRPIWNTATKTERSHLKFIDDGFHPLLEETPSVDTDYTEISSIQKLLGEALSFSGTRKDYVLPLQSGCIPPCSIWCSSVPAPAKDTYKRFIKKVDSESIVNSKEINSKILRPLYKRCFSADDTHKDSNCEVQLQSTSSKELRERLLFRKDSVSLPNKTHVESLKDFNRKTLYSNLMSSEQVTKNVLKDCDLWSPYDGADSKWQPLPDCIPLNDHSQKSLHRKARDIRRQKSVC